MKLFQSTHILTVTRHLALLVTLSCSARLSAAEPVSLDALVAETVARNPELKFYEAEIAAAKGGAGDGGRVGEPGVERRAGE